MGIPALAEALKVDRATIHNWKAGFCDPRIHHLRAIRKLSRGEISYDQMIDRPRVRNNKAAQKRQAKRR